VRLTLSVDDLHEVLEMTAYRSGGLFLVVAFVAALWPSAAESQVWKRVTEKARQAAAAKAREAEEKARGAVRCVIADSACAEKAKAAGKSVVLTDPAGNAVAQNAAQPPRPVAAPATPSAQTVSHAAPVTSSNFEATVSHWWTDDGARLLQDVTFSGRAVAVKAYARLDVRFVRCDGATDRPRSLWLRVRVDSVGMYRFTRRPDGAEIENVWAEMGGVGHVAQRDPDSWVRVESVSEDSVVGSAELTFPHAARVEPTAGDRGHVKLKVRFRAPRASPIASHSCSSNGGDQAAATSAAPVAPLQSTSGSSGAEPAARATLRTATAYKPAYPFGLENLLNAIDSLSPARQKEIRRAYNDARDLWRIHDPGCLARAYMDITRNNPMSADALSSTNSYMSTANVPLHLCLDRSKVVEFVRGIALTREVVHAGHPLHGAYSGASPPQRRQFASCIVEGYADIFIEMSLKPGANMKTDHVVVIARRHFDEMATACKPHLG
jgi:hypothetical protein